MRRCNSFSISSQCSSGNATFFFRGCSCRLLNSVTSISTVLNRFFCTHFHHAQTFLSLCWGWYTQNWFACRFKKALVSTPSNKFVERVVLHLRDVWKWVETTVNQHLFQLCLPIYPLRLLIWQALPPHASTPYLFREQWRLRLSVFQSGAHSQSLVGCLATTRWLCPSLHLGHLSLINGRCNACSPCRRSGYTNSSCLPRGAPVFAHSSTEIQLFVWEQLGLLTEFCTVAGFWTHIGRWRNRPTTQRTYGAIRLVVHRLQA